MFDVLWLLLNILCIGVVFSDKCGYKSCHQISYTDLNVHIVAHSHDDVGWTSTVDNYYKNDVIYILDSVLDSLKKNPKRKFIQVETAFFYEWWIELHPSVQKEYRKLINNGQLEITGGAWSMNDEATTNYQSIIDQFTLGLRVINDTLGECGRPKIGWQIDPFGHSKEMASIFAQLGYDAVFLGRLDYRDKIERCRTHTAEMIWQGSSHLGNNSNIFTSILFNQYQYPDGFCFDLGCSERITSKNRQEKIQEFADFVRLQAIYYATNNILITMGKDFSYDYADYNFQQIDYLIEAFNEGNLKLEDGRGIKLFYSTPSCYVKAVNEMAINTNLPLKLKTDDFFPYANTWNSYWTGFYSSRPTLKRFERQGNNLLQVSKQLATFIKPSTDYNAALFPLQRSMGVLQHHDAITGTETQKVAFDYARMHTKAMQTSIEFASERLIKLLAKRANSELNVKFDSCLLSNISVCHKTNGDFLVSLYNPLEQFVQYYVKLPVNSTGFNITSGVYIFDIERAPYQISEKIKPTPDLQHPEALKYELTFYTKSIPPLGAKLYYITKNTETVEINTIYNGAGQYLGTKSTGFTLDSYGYLSSITMNNIQINVRQSLMYYVSRSGINADSENCRSSGAYCFSPEGKAQRFQDKFKFTVFNGPLFDEVHQEFSSWAKQVIRVYKQKDAIEFEYMIGPINIGDGKGKEVISRFDTSLDSGDIFYTDTNGRDYVQRKRNRRETFPFTVDSIIAGNYYPVTSKIMIQDNKENTYFTILNDRSQGGSSLKSGQLELMLHRRCLHDDNWGVNEALNEKSVHAGLISTMQHFISLGPKDNNKDYVLAQEKLLEPWIFIADITDMDINYLQNQLRYEFRGAKWAFPDFIHLLSMEPWKVNENKILMRVEHVTEYALSDTLHLDDIFKYFTIKSITETTLGGNQLLSDNKKFGWRICGHLNETNNQERTTYIRSPKINGLDIWLHPKQIRTFIAEVEYTHNLKMKDKSPDVRTSGVRIPVLRIYSTDEDEEESGISIWFNKAVNWIKSLF